MHIPDGYLSPETCAVMAAASAPFLVRASNEVQKRFHRVSLPMVGVFGAFSFLVMMLNLPLPGGTTGHAVGTVLASIVLGPWLSMIAVSLALVIQALFFGDGGILAIGANIFNMAIVMSWVGYGLFHLLGILTRNRWSAPARAGIAGYVAINVAALATGIELGLQPLLFKNTAGHALYFPYPLVVSVPAMLLGHLVIAGFAEAIISSFGYAWLLKQYPGLIEAGKRESAGSMRAIFLALSLIIFIVPLGLLAPGTAWGEWSRQELGAMKLGYIPSGFDRMSTFWTAPLSGYNATVVHNPALGYVISALVGVVLILGVFIFVEKLATKSKPPAHTGKSS